MVVREIARWLEQWELGAKDVQRRAILAPTPRERERWQAILLLSQGWTAAAAAELLDRDPHTRGEPDSIFLSHHNPHPTTHSVRQLTSFPGKFPPNPRTSLTEY